jgi:hypothetical protein
VKFGERSNVQGASKTTALTVKGKMLWSSREAVLYSVGSNGLRCTPKGGQLLFSRGVTDAANLEEILCHPCKHCIYVVSTACYIRHRFLGFFHGVVNPDRFCAHWEDEPFPWGMYLCIDSEPYGKFSSDADYYLFPH